MATRTVPLLTPVIDPALAATDLTALRRSDLKRFLREVDFALAYDLDEEDAEPHELAAFRQSQADAAGGRITPVLLEEALKYRTHIQADWLVLERAVDDRWHRVLAAFGKISPYVEPVARLGRPARTLTIAGVRYERL